MPRWHWDICCILARGGVNWKSSLTYLLIASSTVTLYVFLSIFWVILDKLPLNNRIANSFFTWSPKRPLLFSFFGVIFIGMCWTMVFLAAFPGYYCYDTRYFNSFIANGSLNDYQPVIHTLLVGEFIKLGESIFGTFNLGIAFYITLQVLLLLIFSFIMIRSLQIFNIAGWTQIFMILFYALNPLISTLVCCTVKDTMFSAFLLLVGIILYKACMPKTPISIKWSALLFLICLISLLYRNNTIYVFILFLPLILIRFHPIKSHAKQLLRIATPFLASIVACIMINSLIYPLLGVQKNNSVKEMISIPEMQLARICAVNEERDLDLFSAVNIDPEVLGEIYKTSTHCSDPTRALFWNAIENEQYAALWELYLANIPHNIGTALDSTLILTEASWSPFASIDGYNTFNPYYEYNQTETSLFACTYEEPAYQSSFFPKIADWLWKVSRYNYLQSYPLTHWLVAVPFYTWLLLLTSTRVLIKRDISSFLFCSILLALCLTNALGPMVLPRYYLPLILSTPLLLGFLFKSKQLAPITRI